MKVRAGNTIITIDGKNLEEVHAFIFSLAYLESRGKNSTGEDDIKVWLENLVDMIFLQGYQIINKILCFICFKIKYIIKIFLRIEWYF